MEGRVKPSEKVGYFETLSHWGIFECKFAVMLRHGHPLAESGHSLPNGQEYNRCNSACLPKQGDIEQPCSLPSYWKGNRLPQQGPATITNS